MSKIERLRLAAVMIAVGLLAPVSASASPPQCRMGAEGKEVRHLLGGHWERRAELYERDVTTSLSDISADTPTDRNMGLALPDVDRIVTGEMATLDYLDASTRRFRSYGASQKRRIPFVLTLPETDDEEVPVVVFGHGVKTSRELVYLVANTLAENGYAVFAIDFPYHGARAICTRHSDCAGDAWCTDRGACRSAGDDEGRLRTVEAPEWMWPGGPSYPLTSGRAFLELDDFRATRAHFAQALVDLMQSVRVIQGADWHEATNGYRLDGEDITYVGVSLGGIIGADLAAVEPEIDTYVLNAAGGEFLHLIQNSVTLTPKFERMLLVRGYHRNTAEYADFRRRAQSKLSHVDPVDVTPHATRGDYAFFDAKTDTWKCAPDRNILLQMGDGDEVVPNRTTRRLASAADLSISVYQPFWLKHHYFLRPTSPTGTRARRQAVEFLDSHR